MAFFNKIFSTLKKSIAYKKTAIALLFLLFLWLGLRSCSNNEALKDHVFLIAADNKWFPSLAGKEQYMQGFTTDLLQEISREEDFRFRFMPAGSSQIYSNLDRGMYDAAIGSLIPDIFHREKYTFSDPFYLLGPVLVVPEDSTIKTIQDLDGKSIGIRRGSSAVFILTGYPGIALVTFGNMNDALVSLLEDRLDAVIMDSMIAHYYMQGVFAGRLKVVTNPLTEDGLRMIVLHGDTGEYLIEKFNAGLKKVRENGTYRRLLQKWDLVNADIEIPVTP